MFGLSAAQATTLGTISGIENLYTSALATTGTIDASIIAGVTNVQLDAVAGAANGVKVTTGQSVTLSNTAVTNTTTISGNTPTALTLNLNKVGAVAGTTDTVDLNGEALATLNITSTGAASKITLTNTAASKALATLNISGDQGVTITEALVGVKTINASTATGAVSIDKSTVAANLAFAFTGGSANDTLKLAAGDLAILTAGSQLNGGAGTGDKLTTLDTTFSAADYAKINATVGFEVLGTGAAAAAVDASKLTTIKSFAIDGDGIQSYSNLATGSAVSVSVAHAATIGISTTVGVSDLSLAIGTATTTGFTVGGTVTVGATTVALSSNGTNAAANVISTLANADNSTYTITGSNDLTITSPLAGVAIGSKIDATAFTGKLNVTGSALSDIIIGGSGADTINGGAVTHTVAAVAAVKEVFVATFGATIDADTVTFDGVAKVLTSSQSGTASALEYATAYNLAGGANFVAVANLGTVTFTQKIGSNITDKVTGDFVVTSGGAGADIAVTAAVPTTQGVTAVTAVVGSSDILTGNGGADIFSFTTAAVATTAGAVTATITDFVTGVDTIKLGTAGSVTNYLEATSAAATFAAMLTAADTALNGTVQYYVGQVGADSYLVTDVDGAGYTNVIKLTGVDLAHIAQGDIVA